MKSIILHSRAKAELDGAMAFYEKKQVGLGIALNAEVERTLKKIQQSPQLGAPYKSTEYRYSMVRRFSYVVFYLEMESAIWIAAIAHGRRRPDYWKSRRIE